MLFLLSALAAVMLQVAAQTCQLHQSPATFGQWTTCANITDGSATWTFPAGMQCRNVSYPSTYVRVPDNNATLWTQEKRFVKGTPAAIIYIIADAGQNSDLFALGTLQQIDAALTTNYAVYIPALRGSYHSVVFPDYPTFPVGLWNAIKTPVNGVNYTDLSVTNTAMDLILSIQNAAGQYPKATLNVLAVSYGTVVAQRILAIRPGLLKGAILDSPIPAVNGSNLFYDANNFLDNLSQYMLTNCAKAPVCAGSTLSNAQLVAFINNLKTQTNPCVETFASAIGFVGGSSKKDLLQSLLNIMMNLPNLAIPKYLINGTLLTSTQIQTGFEQAWLDTAALKYPDANKVIVDFRALALALLNQLAQCNYNAPPARITAFNNALLTFKPIVKLVLTAYPVSGVLFAKQQIDRTLLQLSEGRLPAASTNAVLNKTAGSFLVAPPTIFAAEDLLLAETSKIPAFTDCYSNKAPAGVQTKVYFVSGHLDARESFVESQRSYNNLAVAGAGKKTFYISNNAGHGVFTNGFTKCSLILYRGVFLQISKALNKFAACLNTDNASPVAWSQQLVSSAVGTNSSIWAGLSPSFTGAPTTSPTLAPTNAPTLPTPKPTSPPPSKSPTSASPTKLPTSLAPTTPPPSKSPTSGSPTKLPTSQAPTTTGPTKQPTTAAPTTRGPSAAPTSFKDYCNSFTTSSTCTTAGCVWRSTTKRCTTGSTPSPTA